jgi:hypothetical protein
MMAMPAQWLPSLKLLMHAEARLTMTRNLDAYLACVAASIRLEGWHARQDSEPGQATADRALRGVAVTEADRKVASMAKAWAQSLTGDDDYGFRLREVALDGTLAPDDIGYAASMVQTFLQAQEHLKRNIALSGSEFVGKVRERVMLDVRLLDVQEIPSKFGRTTICRFADKHNNLLVWFATTPVDAMPGQTFSIKATVKQHEIYRGIKQTVLERVTIV